MKVNIAGITDSCIDGLEYNPSFTIFFQGCSFRCKGCQNPETQGTTGGYWVDTEDIIKELNRFDGFYKSVTFTGGDPTFQEAALLEIASKVILPKILYTGMLYEDLSDEIKGTMDIVVDGQYKEELKQNGFPASANQRIINTKNRDLK